MPWLHLDPHLCLLLISWCVFLVNMAALHVIWQSAKSFCIIFWICLCSLIICRGEGMLARDKPKAYMKYRRYPNSHSSLYVLLLPIWWLTVLVSELQIGDWATAIHIPAWWLHYGDQPHSGIVKTLLKPFSETKYTFPWFCSFSAGLIICIRSAAV